MVILGGLYPHNPIFKSVNGRFKSKRAKMSAARAVELKWSVGSRSSIKGSLSTV